MTGSQLLVNPLVRDHNTVESEVSLRGKIVRTPTFIPRIDSDLDVSALVRRGLMYNPGILALKMPRGARALMSRSVRPRQLNLSLRPVVDTPDQLLEHSFVLADPSSELFYYAGHQTREERRELMRFVSLPSRLRELLGEADTSNHNRVWIRISNMSLLLALTDAFYTAQNNLGVDIAVPPSPLITGENADVMLDILNRVNLRLRIAASESEVYPAFYIPVHSRVFRSQRTLKVILDLLESAAAAQSLILFKVVWYSNVERVEERRNLGWFLAQLDHVRQSNADRLCVMSLESGTEGHAMLFNGVDGYAEPVSGRVGPPRRAGKGADRTLYGSYLHPVTREMIPWAVLEEEVAENGGYLPHDCMICENLHGRVSENDLDSGTWNVLRRAHHHNVRMTDVEEGLKPAIGSGSVREEFLRFVENVDARLGDLAPPDWRGSPI